MGENYRQDGGLVVEEAREPLLRNGEYPSYHLLAVVFSLFLPEIRDQIIRELGEGLINGSFSSFKPPFPATTWVINYQHSRSDLDRGHPSPVMGKVFADGRIYYPDSLWAVYERLGQLGSLLNTKELVHDKEGGVCLLEDCRLVVPFSGEGRVGFTAAEMVVRDVIGIEPDEALHMVAKRMAKAGKFVTARFVNADPLDDNLWRELTASSDRPQVVYLPHIGGIEKQLVLTLQRLKEIVPPNTPLMAEDFLPRQLVAKTGWQFIAASNLPFEASFTAMIYG